VIGLVGCFFLGLPASAESPVAQSNRSNELSRAGKYSEALPLAQAAVASLERTSPNSRDFAGALNNLAQLYGDLGRDADAEPLQERALALMEKAVGLDSPDIAPEMNNLAALYQRQGRYAEAEPLFRRALAIYEKAAGPEHPAVATLLSNLGQVLKVEGRYDEAESLIKRSLAIHEKAQGRDHPDTARSLNNLADLYQREHRYARRRAFSSGARCRSANRPSDRIIRRPTSRRSTRMKGAAAMPCRWSST
jgi:tetratricopeptide (TPR) repeat protein